MRRSYIFCICLAVLFLACNAGNSRKAFEYSERIVGYEHKLMPDIQATEQAVGNYLQMGKYDSAKASSEAMATKVENVVQEIKNTPVPAGVKEGEPFKQAAIAYFEKIKAIYNGYTSLAANATDNAVFQSEAAKLATAVSHKEQAVKDIYDAQQKFAKANNFNIEDKK